MLRIFAFCILFFLNVNLAFSNQLIIQNTSDKKLLCRIDKSSKVFEVLPRQQFSFSLNDNISEINSVECNGLKARNMRLTKNTSDHWFIYNGKANRVLNVLLYPYIPTLPYGDFSSLLK